MIMTRAIRRLCAVLMMLALWPPLLPDASSPTYAASSPGCGHERWAVKVLTDPAATRVNMTPVTTKAVEDLRALSMPAPGGRPPGMADARYPQEMQTYQVRARLIKVKHESDLDYHVVIEGRSGATMIAEVPDPQCVASSIRAQVRRARTTVERLLGRIPGDRRFTDFPGFPSVTVTGVLFFDVPHATPQEGVAPNNVELHPVLDIR